MAITAAPWDASAVYNALVNGRPTTKQQAIRAIDSRDKSVDVGQLRAMLITSLRGEFKPPRAGVEEDQRHSDTRCWLLSALARVASDDLESSAQARRHLNVEYEAYEWARFWTFEGFINAKVSDLRQLAEPIANSTTETPVVRSLARVVLAGLGDEDALEEIQRSCGNGHRGEQWAVIRSLRVVPNVVPFLVRELCSVVTDGKYADITFDAIVALGRIPPESQHAEKAAQTLATFLINHRWPSYEAMRGKALEGLGNLRVERTAPVLIEELQDESPAVVDAASRALERVLGVRTATRRLLEALQSSGPQAVPKFATALRSMDRHAVVEALETMMVTSTEAQHDFARDLLSEVGGQFAFQKLRARTDAASKYVGALEQAEEKIRVLFETSIKEAQHGFRLATRMDIAVFALGICLIGVSAALLLATDQTLDKWAGVGITGGAGVLSILYSLLVARPRDQVRDAVDHLMYLKVVFLGYLRQLHQTDQAFTRRLLEEDRLAAEEVERFAETVGSTMASAIAQLAASGSASRGTHTTLPEAKASRTHAVASLGG